MKAYILSAVLIAVPLPLSAGPKEDYTIDRRQVYEFTQKPAITKQGDRVIIRFASKDFCDATVVIENEDGTIIRHLASGVLGSNAPKPFQKNSLKQTVVWEGKNDLGRYVDVLKDVRVRVSLGLKPRFERTLFWHPKKRVALGMVPRAAAQPEGVYVYEGGGVETVRLFDHKGRYIRTVCPFPAGDAEKIKGLGWYTFPDGHKAPRHTGYWKSSYMVGGGGDTRSGWGSSAKAFTVWNGSIASVRTHLCRLGVGDALDDYKIYGPNLKLPGYPHSLALSPERKWLYITGLYQSGRIMGGNATTVRWWWGVYRMEFNSGKRPSLWIGDGRRGKSDTRFDYPTSVCVDRKGRVYVSDHFNDRVQIYSPDVALVKSLPVHAPAKLAIHHKTQELYVFSWNMGMTNRKVDFPKRRVSPKLSVFDPFKTDKAKLSIALPMEGGHYYSGCPGTPTDAMRLRAELDSYADPPMLWMAVGNPSQFKSGYQKNLQLSLFRLDNGRLTAVEHWNDLVEKALKEWEPIKYKRRRMYVDHRTGSLYVAGRGGRGGSKIFSRLVRIRPDSGEIKLINLPIAAEDAAIDNSGHIYLRCNKLIGRFDLTTMREVPFDYGEERLARWYNGAGPQKKLISALILPGTTPGWWHESGMGVNARGELVVSTANEPKRNPAFTGFKPIIYPGRMRYQDIHIWDKHGNMTAADQAKGSTDGHGTLIDNRGDVYFLSSSHRVYNGTQDFFPLTGCIIKFKRNRGRFLAKQAGVVPLSKGISVDGLPQINNGTRHRFYIKDAEWIFPGVGFCKPIAPCQCWNCRFAIDYFGRVFAPETVRNQVAVLDTSGNLITHIGTYGNADDGRPLVEDMRYRTRPPRSIGGDEVALSYANYVATHSDRRLFIADGANDRILSVKLDYHRNEYVALGR